MIRHNEPMVTDRDRLDWLQVMANKPGGVLLHDGSESGRRGLGLRPGMLVRDLRAAIDAAFCWDDLLMIPKRTSEPTAESIPAPNVAGPTASTGSTASEG